MKEISVIAATNVAEAGRLLQEHPQSVLMAGGTDLLVLKKLKLVRPRVIVTLKSIPGFSTIRSEKEGGVAIGAFATLDEVATHPLIRQRVPLLARAAAAVASPQIRNKATL
ncbi:MAG: FAD binding domain-containing protein, partial [Isosphaeraceae bacterium]